MNELNPITREEAYRTLRLLALRMDTTAKGEQKAQTMDEAKEQLLWAMSIEHVLNALAAIK